MLRQKLRKFFPGKDKKPIQDKEEEKPPASSPAKDNDDEEMWMVRWEYDELPSKRPTGIIFSPSVKLRRHYPEEFTFSRLMRIYKAFDEGKVLIGHVESCVTSHGRMPLDSHQLVPAECMHFIAEPAKRVLVLDLKFTGQLQHPNILQAFGWCEDRDSHTFSMVHELADKGNLYSHLHFPALTGTLPWAHRYRIACGLAEAIHYLHEDAQETSFHIEINSQNVLLDSDFNAKLTNLGAFKFGDDDDVTVLVVGTSGLKCLKPVGEKHGQQSNVRNFGIVALELVCGVDPDELARRDSSVWHHAMEFYAKGALLDAVDPLLDEDFNEMRMERLLQVGLWCAQPDYGSRPSIKQVIRYLKLAASPPSQLPTATLHAFLASSSAGGQAVRRAQNSTPARRGTADDTFVYPEVESSRVQDESGSPVRIRSDRSGPAVIELSDSCDPFMLSMAILSVLTNPEGLRSDATRGNDNKQPSSSVVLKELSSSSSSSLSPVPHPGVDPEKPPPFVLVEPDGDGRPAKVDGAVVAFDIGIPRDYRCSKGPLKEYQVQLVNGALADLRQIIEKDELQLDGALEMIRNYTKALVAMGIPIGSWNSLMQDVLNVARDMDLFRSACREAGYCPPPMDLAALGEDAEQCGRNLEKTKEELAMLLMRKIDMEKQLGDVRREIEEAEEERRRIEQRRARETENRECRKKELDMLEFVQSVSSKISLFSIEC